jgi:hypothetical protein
LITEFTRINNTISAESVSAILSALVGKGIRVSVSTITLLSDNSTVGQKLCVFFNTISTSTVRNSGESVEDLFQKFVSVGTNVKQNRENGQSLDGSVLSGVEELDFKGVLLVSNPMLAGLVEFNMGENIGGAFPIEGSAGDDWQHHL